MNRIYKVIFNTSLGLYQVVSEIARNHGKSSSGTRTGRKSVMVPFIVAALLALPVGTGALAADTDTSTNTQTNTTVTVNSGDQLKGTGAAAVSSTTTTDGSTKTITIDVPKNGKVESGNNGLVTGGMVYAAVNAEQTARETADTTLTNKIGTLDANGNYIQKDASVSSNLSTLDTHVKTNADAISKEKTDRETAVTNVTNTVSSLSDSAVKYDSNTNKTKVTLAGEGGTTISNVKDGALSDSSTEAVTGKQLYAEQSARTAADTAITNKIGALSANGNYIQKDASVSSNLSTLDIQVKTNATAISTETANREKAVSDEATARTNAINALETKLTSGSANSLVSKANVNASNIGNNLTVADGTSDDAKKTNLEAWGSALGAGAIASGDVKLLSGGTLFTELRPSADGTYSYISSKNTTAVNLKSLDSAIAALGVEMLTDKDGNPIQYTSSLFKYFKVNPEFTTNTDGTKTYAADAAANGTNSVAIGPNAKTAQYTTTTTSGDITTTTETAADHAVAIGDGATVNAAGDKGLAIGNGASVGEAESTTTSGTTTTTTDAKGGESSVAIGDSAKANGKQALAFGKGASVLNPSGTAVSTGSTAIGSGAKVDGGDNSIALGTNAAVNTVSDAMALGNGAAINKTAAGSIAIGKEAATGGVDKPITLTNGTTGTLAAAGGVDSIAIGNGAVSEGNEALALGKGAKVTNGATGGDSAAAIVKTGSAAIGDGATVANSATSMAIGNGASITEGENTIVIGSGAKASQTKQAFVAGYQASADSNASGSIALGDNASTHSEHTTAIGYKAEAHNADSIAIGSQAVTSDTGGGIAIGSNTSVAQGGIAVGKAANAQNISSLAIGNGAAANVNQSISIGYNAGVGTAEEEKEKNGSLVAIGTSAGNNVKGMQNVAIGASAGSSVLSSNNIAIGTNAGYGIKNVTSTTDTNPQNGYNISIGSGANYTEGNTNQNIVSSIAIGHNTHAVNRAVALGEGAAAKGDAGMALGNSASSDGADSIALGSTASAMDGNIALGAGSVAKGSPSGNARWTSQVAPEYYISVGNTGGGSTDSPLLRRISNVADGSDDHDVATVAQLQKVADQLKDTITGTDSDNKDVKTYSTTYIDNEVTELKNDIASSKTKYFSVNPGSQTANADGTAAHGDGDVDAMAIGPNAKASNVKALAIGNNVSASGTLSIAIGTANNPSTDTTTADNPHPTSSEGVSSVAVGTSAIAQSDNSIAIGTRATTYTSNTTGTPVTNVGVQSIAIGYGAETRAENAISFGTTAKANSTDSIAVGHNAQALNDRAIVIGSSTAYGSNSVTIGLGNTNNGAGVLTTGNSNEVTNSQKSTDAVKNSGIYGSSNQIHSVTTSNSGNAITDVSLVGNANELNQNGEMNVLNDVSVLGNNNTIENGTAGDYTQTVKQIAVVGSGNKVTGNTQVDAATWGTVQRDTILGYGNTVDATKQSTPVSNLQILGNDVKATLGNSVYLGTGSSATASKSATAEAIQLAKDRGDTEALASDEYKNAATDEAKNAIKQKYEAKHIHAANIAAMDKDGVSAGVANYDTDYTYGKGSTYTYAGSQADGVVTVGSKDATRRIQNVSAGLVGPNSTDAVNGSQLYALTRQIRFGGDNSSFGKTTAAEDQNVVARGSNETISITGGSDAVTSSTADGTTTYTVDAAKLTDNNIAVVADKNANALHVQLASNLKDLNTAQLGTGSGDSYKETIKLDGTNGKVTVADSSGTVKTTLDTTGLTIAGGPKFTSSGIDAASQKITSVKAGEADTDAANVGQVKSARTLLTQGTNTTLGDVEADGHHTYTVNVDNLAVKANGTGTTTVALANGINFKNGTNTTSAVDSNGNVTIDTKNLALKANGTNTATVTMDNGINFKNGTNTTATVGTDGTVTISATHNKLSAVSAAPTGTNDDVTLTLTDTDGNTVTSTGLKNTYTTVTTDGTAHTVTFARNDGTTKTLSLGDLDGASTEALNKAAAKATSEVTNGTNVASVTKTAGTNGQNIYTVNVDDLAVKTTSGEKKSVHLADGLVFADGTNTTATVGDNGTIKFNVSDAAIKKQAVEAVNVTGGSNVTVTPVTNADGTLKTFTVTATHNKLNAAGSATKATADSNAVTLTLQDADGNTTTTGLTDTYTTVSKDGTNKKVTFKRNDGETQTLELSDLGGITAAQDKYITGGTVSYDTKGDGTAALTGTNGITASITGLKDTKVSSGTATYVGTQGDASGSATLTMNDGSKATISGLKDDYITSAAVGTETNHVTMTRLGGGMVDLNLNPILEKYSLSDYHLVGAGTTHDQPYAVDSNGTVTLNVVDDKNPTGTPKTIQITGLASQTGVNAGRTTVTSSDSSVKVSDSTANSNTHTYDIKVDYTKIPANLRVQYSGDNGTAGSNTMDKATAFSGTAGQIVTTAENGKVSFKLTNDISGINSVTTGDSKLDTNGLTVTGGPSVLKSGINAGGKTISNVGDAAQDTDAATLGQVKNARTVVTGGSNVDSVTPSEGANNQMTYTVNVDNLSVKANKEVAKSVTLKNGLTFNNGTNTTASVGDNGEVKYDLNSTLTGLTSVTAGNSTLNTDGLIIKDGISDKVVIKGNTVTMGGNVIHNVGDGVALTDAVNKGQLEALQTQVSGGWNLSGNNAEGTAVTAQIGAGKTVTYGNGNYTKAVVTKDDTTGIATVNVDVTTGVFGSGTGDKAGTVTATANGLATTQDVANAINSAYWTIQDGDNPGNAQQVKAGDNTVSLKAGDNLSLDQNGKEFTYKLNKTLTGMTSVTAVDDKKNTAVLNGEGLKVSDEDGNSLTQHATEIRIHDSSAKKDDTTTDVVLKKDGLHNGGHTITGVADGTIGENSQDAINGSQFYKLQQSVTNGGWNITGEDTNNSTHIGNDKTVSFKNGAKTTVEVIGSDTGAVVKVNVNTTAISTDAEHKATATGDGLATASDVANTINAVAWNVKKNGGTVQQVKAGDTVTFDAGANLALTQNGTSFTYGLAPDVNTKSIRLGGSQDTSGSWTGGIFIGKQIGGGANQSEGNYITGLDNTSWDLSKVVDNRAATEAQLKEAINQITLKEQNGGFALTGETGSDKVSQTLGNSIAIVGDTEYENDGKTVKTQGNITTEADSTNVGGIKIKLNKDINLGNNGSLTIGSSSVTNGQAMIGSVTVNGTDNTVSGLSNTDWNEATANADGYKNSTKAATESQLQAVYDQATSTASANEQHIKAGTYDINTATDHNGNKKNSVTMNIVDGSGKDKGTVVINDVAKASDVGDTDKLAADIKNQNGGQSQPTSVVEAVNNLNEKVNNRVGDNKYSAITSKAPVQDGDSSTMAIGKLNNRMNDIYNKAAQHTSVSVDENLTKDDTKQNASGGTDYKIGLNKENIDLGHVTIKGNAGSISAKSMTADSFTAGDTAVNKDGIKIGKKSALTGDSLTVNGKTYVDEKGINANGNTIRNIGEGKEDTDAVNVKQVNDLATRQGAAITENAAHISQLGQAVNKLDNRINRVGAGAAALAALHPGDYDPDDKLDVSAGVGNYRGANAAAVGLFFHPNERTILSVAGSMGGGENMVNAGVTLKVGPGHGTPTTVTTKTGQKVDVMDILAKQTEILEKLAGNTKAASAPAGSDIFPDVPQNHWAYAYVDKLYRAGSLAGFSEPGKLKSHMLTRKDFAEILYWAMTNGATTNPELNGDGSLNRLAAEFGAELKLVMK